MWQIRLLNNGVPLSICLLNESKELANKIRKTNIHIPKYEWLKKDKPENKLYGLYVKCPLHYRVDTILNIQLRYLVRLTQVLSR